MFVLKDILAGATRGGFYGLTTGIILGGAGYMMGAPTDYQKLLVWKNQFGKNTQFTFLETAAILKNDLLVIFNCKSFNENAFNETFRNIQSAIAIYHPIKTGMSHGEITSGTRMTSYAKKASRAMEAMLLSIDDVAKYTEFEKSMMAIQLNLEDFINFVHIKTSKIVPDYGK